MQYAKLWLLAVGRAGWHAEVVIVEVQVKTLGQVELGVVGQTRGSDGFAIRSRDGELAGKKLVLIDADEAARTKHLGVFSEVAGTHIALAGAHLAFPGVGHLRAEGSGFRWIPIPFELGGPR